MTFHTYRIKEKTDMIYLTRREKQQNVDSKLYLLFMGLKIF
jgi:hypothetical protein